jgi:hypothetical protein
MLNALCSRSEKKKTKPGDWLYQALRPTEVRYEFLKSSFFVVTVFLWPNRAIFEINKYASGGDQKPPHGPLGMG